MIAVGSDIQAAEDHVSVSVSIEAVCSFPKGFYECNIFVIFVRFEECLSLYLYESCVKLK